MRVVLLLALVGLSCGLQPDIEYVYQYFGRVDTGMPSINNQGASTAVKANIRVVVHKDGHAHFQIEHPMFAEYHGDLGCNQQDHSYFNFVEPQNPELIQSLSASYEVNLFGPEDYVINLQNDEPLWFSNVRKAITGLFRNKLMSVNFENQHSDVITKLAAMDEVPETFSVKEETIFGRCNIDYTVHKVPDVVAIPRLEQFGKIEVDEQRPGQKSGGLKTKKLTSKTRKTTKSARIASKLTPIDDQLWHVVRTVDFEHCDYNVGFQRSSGGVDENIGDGQKSWISGRSSFGEYILRGSSKGFRIEVASIEGLYSTVAASLTKDKLRQTTNQTLHLVSVTSVKTDMPDFVPQKTITTWMHQVMTPMNAPKVSTELPYVIYTGNEDLHDPVESILGIKPTKESVHLAEKAFGEILEFAANTLTSEKDTPNLPHGEVAKKLQIASQLVMSLPKESIQKFIDDIMVEKIVERSHETMKKKLLVDVLAASGTKIGIEAVLELIKEERISTLQGITLSMTITQNVNDVRVIPKLVDFVMQMKLDKEPFSSSIALANVANMIYHYCIDPKATTLNYGSDFFGDETCDQVYIKEKFVPYLKDLIYNEDLTFERLAAINALSNLRITSAVEILAPVVLGQKGSSSLLRVAAIRGLERWHLTTEIKGHVIDLLTRVYSDVTELPRVRFAALLATSFYGPKISFWYKIAKLSWREPSPLMASAYTSVLKAFAETEHTIFLQETQAATHALTMAKPTRLSTKYPFIVRKIATIPSEDIMKIEGLQFGLYDFPFKRTNFDLNYYVVNQMRGVFLTSLDLWLAGGNMGSSHSEYKDFPESTSQHKIANDLFEQVQKVIEATPKGHPDKKLYIVFLRFMESMHLYLPFSKESMKALPFDDTAAMGSLFLELQTGMSRTHGKYFVPLNHLSFFPNEMGLAVIGTHSVNVAFGNKVYAQVSVNNPSMTELPQKVHVDAENFFRIETHTAGTISVMIPWTNSMLSTEVSSARTVKLPAHVTANVKFNSKQHPYQVDFGVEPLFQDEFTVVGVDTTPKTVVSPMSLHTPLRQRDEKVIIKRKPIVDHIKLPKTYAGFDLSFDWEGEFRNPINWFDIHNLLQRKDVFDATPKLYYAFASKSARQHSFDIKYNPSASETKKFTLDILHEYFVKEKEDISQVGQTTGQVNFEQDAFSQFGQEEDEFGQFAQEQSFDASSEESGEDFHLGDQQQRVAKMEEYFGGSASCVSFKFGFHGDKAREYEILYSWSKPVYANHKKQRKSHLSFNRTPIPGVDTKPLSVCLDSVKTTPVFSELDTLDSVLARKDKLATHIEREVRIDCTGEPVLRLESDLEFSDHEIETMKDHVQGCCKFDKYDEMFNFYNMALYDKVKAQLTWDDVCEKSRLPLMSKVITSMDSMFNNFLFTPDCDAQDQGNKLTFTAERNPENRLWNYELKRGDSGRHIYNVETCPISRTLFSVASHAKPLKHKFEILQSAKVSEKCSVSLDNVRTFDGRVFEYEASECWTVLASDCTGQSWVVLSRKPSSESFVPEVRIIERNKGIVVDIGKFVKVNGKTVDPESFMEKIYSGDKLIAKVFKQDGHYMVKIPDVVKVAVKDRVEVKTYKEPELCGICGDHNNEYEGDFTGPQGCVFTDPAEFVASWTGGGETCDLYKLDAIRTKAENAQQSCLKVSDYMKLMPQKHNEDHVKYRFTVLEENDLVCITSWTHGVCVDDFPTQLGHDHVITEFKCWPKERCPTVISEALNAGSPYVAIPVNEREATTIHREIIVPRKCLPAY